MGLAKLRGPLSGEGVSKIKVIGTWEYVKRKFGSPRMMVIAPSLCVLILNVGGTKKNPMFPGSKTCKAFEIKSRIGRAHQDQIYKEGNDLDPPTALYHGCLHTLHYGQH